MAAKRQWSDISGRTRGLLIAAAVSVDVGVRFEPRYIAKSAEALKEGRPREQAGRRRVRLPGRVIPRSWCPGPRSIPADPAPRC